MPGPAPKPTALRIIQGNPSKRPLNTSEPQPQMDSGYCPRYLDGYAAEEWRRVVPELRRLGLLTIVDRAALEAYCWEYDTYRKARDILEQDGILSYRATGAPMTHPAIAIANTALKNMMAFMAQFGMTPSSRSKISVRMQEEESAFDAFLKASGQQ